MVRKLLSFEFFLEHFDVTDGADRLLCSDEIIAVKCEDATKYTRYIDVTVSFERANFVIGIENKIYAKDQRDQVPDYCAELESRTHGRYKLLYLSREGHDPSEESTDKSGLELLKERKKFQNASYGDIVKLLSKYEAVCRADSVREFIRQFQQYIKKQYLGESFMGESNFIITHISKHPDILKHTDALRNAIEFVLKPEVFSNFWRGTEHYLKSQGITINVASMTFITSGWKEAKIEHHGSPFERSSELIRVSVCYEPKKINPPVYVAIRMGSERKEMSPELRGKVGRFEERLKEMGFGKVSGDVGSWWCAAAPLPYIRFDDGDELYNILKSQGDDIVGNRAIETGKEIARYVVAAETVWREIENESSPTSVAGVAGITP